MSEFKFLASISSQLSDFTAEENTTKLESGKLSWK